MNSFFPRVVGQISTRIVGCSKKIYKPSRAAQHMMQSSGYETRRMALPWLLTGLKRGFNHMRKQRVIGPQLEPLNFVQAHDLN